VDGGGSRVLMARRVDLELGTEDVERTVVSVAWSDWPATVTRKI
jgi:hypothetical protein